MDTKLTLKLDNKVILKAKEYASSHKTSLSRMIENYLQKIVTENEDEEDEITPLVKSLSGIISNPKKRNEKQEYADYLAKKYK